MLACLTDPLSRHFTTLTLAQRHHATVNGVIFQGDRTWHLTDLYFTVKPGDIPNDCIIHQEIEGGVTAGKVQWIVFKKFKLQPRSDGGLTVKAPLVVVFKPDSYHTFHRCQQVTFTFEVTGISFEALIPCLYWRIVMTSLSDYPTIRPWCIHHTGYEITNLQESESLAMI